MTENKQGTETETTKEATKTAEDQQVTQEETPQEKAEREKQEELQAKLEEALDKQAALEKQLKAKVGAQAFRGTLLVLIVLVVVYAIAHVATFREYGYMHYEAADVAGARRDLLVTVAVLEGQLETPTAIASPAIQALFHDLEQSVLRAETSDEVTGLFDTAAKDLVKSGIQEAVSPKILEAAKSKATQFVSASEEEREVPKQLFQAELETAQAWALDALGAQTMLDQVEQLKETTKGLGYATDSKVGQTLADITQELGMDRPNRRLVAQLVSQVADRIRGPQSLFWSHPGMRWLEVMAWSLAGMLAVRLWYAGKYIATEKFDPGWNWWWWAKIIQAPLLAVAVVLALSYFQLGMTSGETLGFKISLRGQPVELVVAVSFILGLFSDRAYEFLDDLAVKVLGEREQGEGVKKPEPNEPEPKEPEPKEPEPKEPEPKEPEPEEPEPKEPEPKEPELKKPEPKEPEPKEPEPKEPGE